MNLEKKLAVKAIGRRKTSTAFISLIPSKNSDKKIFEVNGKFGEEYFQFNFNYLYQIYGPLQKLKVLNNYNILASVKGGGLTGQAEAIKLAIAKSLCQIDKETYRPLLKKEGFLSRDARIKERRKYGLKKARKASQSSKR